MQKVNHTNYQSEINYPIKHPLQQSDEALYHILSSSPRKGVTDLDEIKLLFQNDIVCETLLDAYKWYQFRKQYDQTVNKDGFIGKRYNNITRSIKQGAQGIKSLLPTLATHYDPQKLNKKSEYTLTGEGSKRKVEYGNFKESERIPGGFNRKVVYSGQTFRNNIPGSDLPTVNNFSSTGLFDHTSAATFYASDGTPS